MQHSDSWYVSSPGRHGSGASMCEQELSIVINDIQFLVVFRGRSGLVLGCECLVAAARSFTVVAPVGFRIANPWHADSGVERRDRWRLVDSFAAR